MHIQARHTFPVSPARAAEMMMSQSFNEDVCKASEPRSFEVTIDGERVVRRVELDAPAAAAKYIKGTATVVQTTTWGPAAADGSRTGDVEIRVDGVPMFALKGTVAIEGTETESTVTYDGDFKISIPLIGKKLEQKAEPYAMQALKVEQSIGEQWLAKN